MYIELKTLSASIQLLSFVSGSEQTKSDHVALPVDFHTDLEDVVTVDNRIEDCEHGINTRHQRLWRTTAAQFTESYQITEHYRCLLERLSHQQQQQQQHSPDGTKENKVCQANQCDAVQAFARCVLEIRVNSSMNFLYQ